jgi:hypothetical protein
MQRRSSAVEARLDRAQWPPDHCRDLLQPIALEIVEDKDCSLVDRESTKGAGEGVAARQDCTGVEARINLGVGPDARALMEFDRRGVRADYPDLAGLTDRTPGRVNEHGPQPGLKGIEVAEPGQIPPDQHERLLHDIVNIDAVAANRPNEPPRAVEPARHELGERFRVTPLSSLDESALAVIFGHY